MELKKLALLIGASTAAAAPNLVALEANDVLLFSLGRSTFTPRANVGMTYSDNISYNDLFKLSDVIIDTGAGLGFKLGKTQEASLVAGYQFDSLSYLDHNQLDAQIHAIQIGGQYQGARLDYKGAATISHLDTLMGGSVADPLLVGNSLKVQRWVMHTSHTLDYEISERTGVYVTPSYDFTDYQTGTPLYDYSTIALNNGFRYGVSPKTRVFGEIYVGSSSVEVNLPTIPEGPSSTFVGGFAGMSFDISAKLTGTVKAGYESRTFSNNQTAPSEPVVDMSLSYKMAVKTTTTLSYMRRSNVSVQGRGETSISDTVSSSVSQLIGNTGKLSANAGITYQLTDYVTQGTLNRSTDYFSANLGLSYNFQLWMRAGLVYSYTKATSDTVGVLQYSENRVSLTLSVGY